MAGYRRPGQGRRKKTVSLRFVIMASVALAIVAILVVLIVKLAGGNGDDNLKPAAEASAAPVLAASAEPSEAPVNEPTQAPTQAPTPEPVPDTRNIIYNVVAPTPLAEGFLPIYNKAVTEEKIIAVTVDDFYQFKNARTIIDVALENGAKLTIFPIGKNVLRDELKDTLIYAHENGIEIENHTYEHKGLYRMDDKAMVKQVYMQALCVDHVLGVDYQEHFFRPMGGDGRDDQRTHQYVKQLGMKGIAHWNVSGSGTDIKTLLKNIKPGNIYLFHTTDKDTEKLKKFIPGAVEQGYKLVTLNEMFGFPENEVRELTKPVKEMEIPALEAFTYVDRTYKEDDFLWQVNVIQQRLIELGYLDVDADGIYGSSTTAAVKAFQEKNGLKANGKCNVQTQNVLFSENAKRK